MNLTMKFATALLIVAVLSSCRPGNATRIESNETVASYSYEIVKIYPHDADAFTQGLVFRDGHLLESTGQEGQSSLRQVDLDSGQTLKKVDLAQQYFGEGMTVMNNKIYQLTWQHHIGFVYDYQTFERLGDFNYEGEGWGLTTDGQSLILSDGSNRLRFLDPNTFRVVRTIAVTEKGKPVRQLNELEFINGEIYSNIWHATRIVTINPQTGAVDGSIDCSGLVSQSGAHDEEAVLNGIAYDQASDRLFLTGKLWPKLFEVKIKK